MEIILASSSKYRLQQLIDFGLPVRAVSPLIDEEELKASAPEMSPKDLAQFLAQKKAHSLKDRDPRAVVIAGDQLLDFEGEILGKPGSPDKATEQLMKLVGKTHNLITALCVVWEDKEFRHLDVTKIKMRQLTRDQAEAYVKHDMTWNCAGSYKIEKSGLALMESVDSQDQSAIMGVPLIALTGALIQWEFPLPFFLKR